MLRLRLQRRGKRNYATYRVIVADQRAPVKGKFVADIGFYNPHTDIFKVNAEAVSEWIGQGAQPSATVNNLLVTHGVIKGPKVKSWQPRKKVAAADASSATNVKPAPAANGAVPTSADTQTKVIAKDKETEQNPTEKKK